MSWHFSLAIAIAVLNLGLVAPLCGQEDPEPKIDELPPGAILRLGSVADGEARRFSGVYHIAFSPDGKTIATRGANHVVVLWDAKTGEALQEFDGHESYVRDIAFSPTGAELLTASDGTDEKVYCWDPKTGEQLRGLAGGAKLLQFVSDDQLVLVSASRHNNVMLNTGRVVDTVTPQRLPLAVSKNGRRLASMRNMTDKAIEVYDKGRQTLALRGVTSFPTMAAFSPDDSLFAVCGKFEDFVRVWDAKTGALKFELSGHTDNVQMAHFSPDSRILATVSWDGSVILWETLTGRQITKIKAHTEHVCSVGFSKSGEQFATGSSGRSDNSVLIWSLQQTALAPSFDADEIEAVGHELVWEQLADVNPAVAWGSVGSLVAAPNTAMKLLHKKLDPVLTPIALERIEQLITELDDDDYYVREAATQALLNQRPAVDPELRKALREDLSVESRYRVQMILSHVPPASQLKEYERRQLLRVVLTLEQLADQPARDLLAAIRTGHPNAEMKLIARQAMERLGIEEGK